MQGVQQAGLLFSILTLPLILEESPGQWDFRGSFPEKKVLCEFQGGRMSWSYLDEDFGMEEG